MYVVYRHTCPNSKVYIGITNCTPETRWQSGYGYKQNVTFFRDIVKYGWDNIKHEVLAEGLTREEALRMESDLIEAHQSMRPQYGHNHSSTDVSAQCKPLAQYTTDGTLVRTFNSVTEAAQSVNTVPTTISRACYHNHVSRGYLWKFLDDTSDLVIPNDLSRRVHKPHNYTFIKSGTKVAQYSKDGFLICTYGSIAEASRVTNINEGSICSCCKGRKGEKGRTVHTAGGYVWKYITE